MMKIFCYKIFFGKTFTKSNRNCHSEPVYTELSRSEESTLFLIDRLEISLRQLVYEMTNKTDFVKALFIICFLVCNQLLFAQSDTIKIREFEIIDQKITPANSFKKTTIDSLHLKSLAIQNLSELLIRNTPAFVKSYGVGGLATISFRGTGDGHTKTYWNGIEINSVTLGGNDFSIIPVEFFSDIELHHGAGGSFIDGAGGLGGSIQLSNTVNWDNKLTVSARTYKGSFTDFRDAISVAFGNEKWHLKTSIYYKSAKNNFPFTNITRRKPYPTEKRQQAEIKHGGVLQEVYYKPNKKNQLALRLMGITADRDIPPLMTATIFGLENQKDQSFRSILEWTNQSEKFSSVVRSSYMNSKLEYQHELANVNSKIIIDSYRNQWRASYTKSSKIKFHTAVTFNYDQANSSGYDGIHGRINQSLLLKADYFPIPNLELNFSGREQIVGDIIVPLLPSLGIVYTLPKLSDLALKANYSRNIGIPTLNQLYWSVGGNPDIKPERGYTAEVGVKTMKRGSVFSSEIELTGFYSEVDDWILWQPNASGIWKANNLKKVENKGIEGIAKSTYVFGKNKFMVTLNYGYTISKNVETALASDAIGKQLIFVPYHNGNANLSIIRGSLFLNYNHSFTGKRYITSDNLDYLPDYNIVNIQFGYTYYLKNHAFYVQLEANNIMDTPYMSIPWRPMPGRHYGVALKYQFVKK